ncbi:hypothetical protein TNCV_1365331 [Trichonephila clavipes]|nr:hypothetical protein TNCV_1365331 [Trichonephila clavipes]
MLGGNPNNRVGASSFAAPGKEKCPLSHNWIDNDRMPSIKTDSPLLYEMTSLLRTNASPPMSPHQSSCSNHTAKESTAPREPQRTLKTLYYFTQDSKRTHD